MTTITKKFLTAFDPRNQDHALWLKNIQAEARALDPNKPSQIHQLIQNNPMNVKVRHQEMMEFPHIQMIVGNKYAEAVLNGKAWIPKTLQE